MSKFLDERYNSLAAYVPGEQPQDKKYIKLNARILAFNVDPDFNYCVDGLIMLDVMDLPKQEIDALTKEFEDKRMVYSRFGLE